MNAPQQSGYILFIMLILLTGFGSAILYSSFNQSSQSKKNQSQMEAMAQLNELKARFIFFGQQAYRLCHEPANAPNKDQLLLPTEDFFYEKNLQNDYEDYTLVKNPLFSDLILTINQVTYTVLQPTGQPTHNADASCERPPEEPQLSYKVCVFPTTNENDPIATLTWNPQPHLKVHLYKSDFESKDIKCSTP